MAEDESMAAPCGLYCGICRDYLVKKECHGCFCECGECAGAYHHKECNIYKCCVEQKGHEGCHECVEFPCSMLIRFCFDPVWMSHLPVIENLRRRKDVGTKRWLKEQKEIFSDEKCLKRWLWFQKECENRWKHSEEEKL